MDAERLMNGVLRGHARGREVAEVLAAAPTEKVLLPKVNSP